MPTNTGNPGFVIDGKTYTFDTVGEGEQGIQPIAEDHGDIKVDTEKKDLSQGTKETLANYVKNLTSVNDYPIDGAPPVDSIVYNADGTHANFGPTPVQNTAYYIRPEDAAGTVFSQPDLTNYSSKQNDPSLALQKPIDGHNFLRSNEHAPYVSTLLQNSRFAPYTPSDINSETKTFEEIVKGSERSQTKFSPRFGEMKDGKLAQVGINLMTRAAGEIGAGVQGVNPSGQLQQLAGLAPGAQQIGATRVSTLLLEAGDVLNSIGDDEILDSNYKSYSSDSWGAFNTPFDQFSGLSAGGMIGLSLAMMGLVALAYEGLGALLTLMPGSESSLGTHHPKPYGRSTKDKLNGGSVTAGFTLPVNVASLLGIRETVFPLGDCIKKGALAFFGIDADDFSSILFAGLKAGVANPGFNVVTCRAIVRSAGSIVREVGEVASKFGSVDVVGGVNGILDLIEALRSNKLILAMNVFAAIGDQILSAKNRTIVDANGVERFVGLVDDIDDDAALSSIMKNRLNKGSAESVKLAYASNRTLSAYLLPKSIHLASFQAGMGASRTGYSEQEELSRTYFHLLDPTVAEAKGARIPSRGTISEVTVKKIEDALEGEYVPFYFHDLRTNEIISFHSFLTQLSDAYSPQWEENQAYGRVEPVPIYGGTMRKIQLSFIAAATSEADFNDMWLKLNKLTTLVYPQYTKGKQLTGANYSYTQPFSQLMGASPFIRLRIGDFVKSNYSRFNLARLFGLGQPGTTIPGAGGSSVDISYSSALLGNPDLLQKFLSTGRGTWFTTTTGVPLFTAGTLSVGIGKPGPQPYFSPNPAHSSLFLLKIDRAMTAMFDRPGMVVCTVDVPTVDQLQEMGMSAEQVASTIKMLRNEYDNGSKPSQIYVGGTYVFPQSALQPRPSTIREAVKELTGQSTSDDAQSNALAEFFDVEKNALVKAFDQTGGRGLPGKIESLVYNVESDYVWRTVADSVGSSAPKMINVQLSFGALHDISPGIDNMGYNRAAVYPVGFNVPGRDT